MAFNVIEGTPFDDNLPGTDGDDEIIGKAGDDTLFGGDGRDILRGSEGDDVLDGGDGRDAADYGDAPGGVRVDLEDGLAEDGFGGVDTLISIEEILGSDFDDTLLGDAADNILQGRDGNDLLDGRGGVDAADYHDAAGGITASLLTGIATGAGTDTLVSIERIYGSMFDDHLTGDSGDNYLEGRDGEDTLIGGDGDDTLRGGAGDDSLDGGIGLDRADFGQAASGVVVDLATGTAQDGDGGTDTLTSIEDVRGSRHADILRDGTGRNSLFGQDGNDTLFGSDGRDKLNGGSGDDVIDASAGSAASQGFGDIIEPGSGNDMVIGHAAAFLSGDGGGIDLIYESVEGTGGVTITVTDAATGTGTAVSASGNVNDTFTFADHYEGSQADDTFLGSDWQAESWVGEGGDDLIDGRGGFDLVQYYLEQDQVHGVTVDLTVGTATDTKGGTDTLIDIDGVSGTETGDEIAGDDRDNFIDGRGGNDLLFGRDGNDIILGRDGDDTILGGDGDDTITDGNLGDSDNNDVIDGGAGDDLIINNGGTDTFIGGPGSDTLQTDVSTLPNEYTAYFNTVDGVHGRFEPSPFPNDSIDGIENYRLIGAWDARMIGGDEANIFESDSGNDYAEAGRGNDIVRTGAGDDVIVDTGPGAQPPGRGKGNPGNDKDVGKAGEGPNGRGPDFWGPNDPGDRGASDGKGRGRKAPDAQGVDGDLSDDDVYSGGSGRDTFIFGDSLGQDRITDFEAGAGLGDLLDLRSVGIGSLDDLLAVGADTSGGAVFDFGAAGQLTLTGVLLADLAPDDIA